ncbi:MAG TPA: hypothetical protein VK308_02560, partial [Pyrinomonadaceae bacterium]|nr:hypothetical protein [Pyrinomonadaceae bacterium]
TLLSLKDYEAALDTFLKAKAGFEKVLEINPENNYAMRMSTYNLNRIGKSYAALAETRNRQEFLGKSLENLRASLDGLKNMKEAGKLGEVDFEAIGEIEEEIKRVESKTNKS